MENLNSSLIPYEGGNGSLSLDKDMELSVVKNVYKKLNQVEQELPFNPELQNKIINRVVENKVINHFDDKVNKMSINIYSELGDFIKIKKSMETKKSYKDSIIQFINYCTDNDIIPVCITPVETDKYMLCLMGKYSSNSVRLKMLSLSSFYTFMLYRHPECFKINPFLKNNYPLKEIKKKWIILPITI
jgi:oligoribonuclease (3'-5' exoribonuclease)